LGVRPAVHAMKNCDLLIMLGTDFPYEDFLNHDVPTLQVDIRAASLGRRTSVTLPIQAHCQEFLRALSPYPQNDNSDFLSSCQNYMKLFLKLMDQVDLRHGDEIKPQNLMRALGQAADDRAIFCCDTGSVTSFFAKSLRIRAQQETYYSGNLASMAFAVSAAMGIQIKHPNRQVIAVTGDGSMNMLPGELGTIAKHKLPVKIFIVNNQRLHLIDFEENAKGLPMYGTELANPDYTLLAQAHGIQAKSIKEPAELEGAIAQALNTSGPYILDVQVNPSQMLFPPTVDVSQAYGFTKAKIKELWRDITEVFEK
jgi:thiamine pyrophosphate-dependent acetolactate synthase large subunit-like protein